ncbi:MAG: right-handed parallel beta-helix repeat-containing protein, partial [Nanoarchaeota archaeon]|nr:right-handed parallel beta-helix repeat-containing protein [Nanoarchaeota archaeon]
MKKLMLFVLLIFVMLSMSGFAYNYSLGALYCGSCDDCTNAINNVTYNVTYLNASIFDYSGICIDSPLNFSNVIFDCQGNAIDGLGNKIHAFHINNQMNNTIKNCIITNFTNSFYIMSYTNMTYIINNTMTSLGYDIQAMSSATNNHIINNTFNSNNMAFGTAITSTIHNNTFIGSAVAIYNPSNSNITNNTFINNTVMLDTYMGTGNIVANNTIINNAYGPEFARQSPTTIARYNNIIDITNTIDGKPVYYYNGINNAEINDITNAGLVVLVSCNNITVSNLIMTINKNGIIIVNSTNITLINTTSDSNINNGIYIISSTNVTLNNISANSNINSGIYVSSSSNVSIINSTISSNKNNGIYLTGAIDTIVSGNLISKNLGSDIYETSSNVIAQNNVLYENKNTSFMTLHSQLRTDTGTITSYNISIRFSNQTTQAAFTIKNISIIPVTLLNYSNTTSEIYGNFTPSRSGIYSIRVNITDSQGNNITNSFNMYSYYDYGINFTNKIVYYIRPDLVGVHGQVTGTDAKTMHFDKYINSDISFHCGAWIAAYIDNLPDYLNGTIKDMSIHNYYRTTGGILKTIRLRYGGTDITPLEILPITYDYQLLHKNYSNVNYNMAGKSWYSINLHFVGNYPSLIDGPNYPNYVEFNYSTDIPMISSRMPDGVKLLSTTFSLDRLNSTEMILDGDGTHELLLNMPELATYDVYRDSILCDEANTDCNFTQTGTTLNVTLKLGSEHTITIQEAIPPVRSAGSPSGSIYSTSATVSLTTNEAAVCRYATSSGVSYSSMSHSTLSSTSHSWPVDTIVAGTYAYYVRCNDTLGNYNTNDYTISFTKIAMVVGDGGWPGEIPIVRPILPSPVADPTDTETETSIADIPLNRPYQIPSGGLCMKVADGLCISVFGDKVTVHNITKIDPNQFKVL